MKQSFTLTPNFFSTSNLKVQNIIGENLDSDVFDCLLVSFAFTVQILKMKTYNYKYKCINAQIQKKYDATMTQGLAGHRGKLRR